MLVTYAYHLVNCCNLICNQNPNFEQPLITAMNVFYTFYLYYLPYYYIRQCDGNDVTEVISDFTMQVTSLNYFCAIIKKKSQEKYPSALFCHLILSATKSSFY